MMRKLMADLRYLEALLEAVAVVPPLGLPLGLVAQGQLPGQLQRPVAHLHLREVQVELSNAQAKLQQQAVEHVELQKDQAVEVAALARALILPLESWLKLTTTTITEDMKAAMKCGMTMNVVITTALRVRLLH